MADAPKDFQYVNTSGGLVTFQSSDAATAVQALSGFKDADPHSGVITPPIGSTTSGSGNLTSSSGTSRTEEKKTGTDITTASDPTYLSPTNDTGYIDTYMQQLGQRSAIDSGNINAEFDALRRSTEDKQNRETGTTSAGLARMGDYLGGSGSGTGVMLSLASSHRAEIIGLENKRQQALAQARQAYEDKNFELAKLKVSEAKDTEQEAYNRKQTYLKQVSDANTAAAKQQSQVDIYNAIANGTHDPMEIFQKLGGQVSIDDINTFLKGVTPKDISGGLAYTPTQTAKLLGSGLSAKDISAAQQYINENGYTEEFRNQLSPSQKVAFDAVYREKAISAKVTGDTGLAVSFVPSKISSVVEQYGISKVFEDLLSAQVPNWFMPVIQELSNNHYADIGLDAPSSLDPDSDLGRKIWSQFKSTPDISMFLQQVTKKITGSSGAASVGGSTSGTSSAFGALNGNLPAPVEG